MRLSLAAIRKQSRRLRRGHDHNGRRGDRAFGALGTFFFVGGAPRAFALRLTTRLALSRAPWASSSSLPVSFPSASLIDAFNAFNRSFAWSAMVPFECR